MQSAGLWPFIQFSPRWGGLHYTLQHPDQSIQVFPITPRDWTDTWKHICYHLLQPFGNDITEIRGAGKYCRSFIIPDAPSPVISEKSQVNGITLSPSPFLYLFPHPTGIHVQMGPSGRGFAWPRSLEGQAFHHLLMQSFPPALATPGVRAPPPHPPLSWPRGQMEKANAPHWTPKSSPHGNQNLGCVFKQTKRREKLVKNQISTAFIPVANLKDGWLS